MSDMPSVHGALTDAGNVVVDPAQDGIRSLTKQRDDAILTMRDFVGRALMLADMIAAASRRGEFRIVEQYLKSLASLRAEAERYGYVSSDSRPVGDTSHEGTT